MGQHGRGSRSVGDGDRKARGRRLRIVEWDAFRKTREERERGDGPITNIDEWTETLRRDVDAATREVPPEANLEMIDSRLLHMWEAKRALLERWRHQRHNRTLRRRIAKLDRDIEEHAFQVCRAQWEETCNGLETQLSSASAWRLFRHLLDPDETRTTQGHKIRRLVLDFGGTPDDFLEAVRERYFRGGETVLHPALRHQIRVFGLHLQSNGHNGEAVRRLGRSVDDTIRLLHRIANRRSGMRKHCAIRLGLAYAISRITYVAPYLKWLASERNKVECMIRKAFKRAVGIPVNASTDRFLELGLNNTLRELIEAHDVAQYERLSKSKTGRHILESLDVTYHAQCGEMTAVPTPVRDRLIVPPLPKNMHPTGHPRTFPIGPMESTFVQ
ncbi:hypothetical protein HPB47_011919 [Ixodes persulcatus]|uniref:Uncharacterized protein n=1 Tax=Ixodes persulcatus TaxID=34615 RepID=A0AC60NUW9_IXOPE|nr:hypothetical protein HPB47_011919 [Ixodes persulcatus]